jgi:hypothetical protein
VSRQPSTCIESISRSFHWRQSPSGPSIPSDPGLRNPNALGPRPTASAQRGARPPPTGPAPFDPHALSSNARGRPAERPQSQRIGVEYRLPTPSAARFRFDRWIYSFYNWIADKKLAGAGWQVSRFVRISRRARWAQGDFPVRHPANPILGSELMPLLIATLPSSPIALLAFFGLPGWAEIGIIAFVGLLLFRKAPARSSPLDWSVHRRVQARDGRGQGRNQQRGQRHAQIRPETTASPNTTQPHAQSDTPSETAAAKNSAASE